MYQVVDQERQVKGETVLVRVARITKRPMKNKGALIRNEKGDLLFTNKGMGAGILKIACQNKGTNWQPLFITKSLKYDSYNVWFSQAKATTAWKGGFLQTEMEESHFKGFTTGITRSRLSSFIKEDPRLRPCHDELFSLFDAETSKIMDAEKVNSEKATNALKALIENGNFSIEELEAMLAKAA